VKARTIEGVDRDGPLADKLARIVAVRVGEVYDLAHKAVKPGRVKAQHDMRIAVKRLRYVLELGDGCFGPYTTTAIGRARDLQDVLGEIHDCDVLIPRVDDELATLRAQDALTLRRLVADPGELPAVVRRAPGRARYRGLETLAAALTARRALLYNRFMQEWSTVVDDRLRKRLERTLDAVSPK
jgi:hypothetical protein